MRGKLGSFDEITFSTRITPACAGKTYIEAIEESFIEDHPRVCGENHILDNVRQKIEGSPPRVRGKQVELG